MTTIVFASWLDYRTTRRTVNKKCSAIFKAHGAKVCGSGTMFGTPAHLQRDIAAEVPSNRIEALKAALDEAGFCVRCYTDGDPPTAAK